ncbi:cryptochrome/photolyase family protein [Acidithrix ferrooxidans]|uniref:cryptochrome/photolyase family protein n=1 Tax=Acidithrix ferrooxidans TaxID=1280514 RepID=UPI000698EE5D|nr:deoxyribodipyrimidine photo-lyase [Acidithrix ferrooxidans]
MQKVIVWLRRDLRLSDNRAMAAALSLPDAVVYPYFVFSPKLLEKTSPVRSSYLAGVVRDLDGDLDGRLNLDWGDPVGSLVSFALEIGATKVYATKEFSPLGRTRDEAVGLKLRLNGIQFLLGDSPYLISPGKINRQSGGWYKVFTPYYRAALSHGFELPFDIRFDPNRFSNRVLFHRQAEAYLEGSDCFDRKRFPTKASFVLEAFSTFVEEKLSHYSIGRNSPSTENTSVVSPALRFGVVHPRQLAYLASGQEGGSDYIRELFWRDFYAQVLLNNPESAWKNLNEQFDQLVYDEIDEATTRSRLQAWKLGLTGYPIVDAGMRQLLATGWMHNRSRMITASFLIKDLHVPWQVGARYFMEHLIDGDLASNNHSWQWVAGSGTDAAPYFRIFNPVLQSKKFDPNGDYIKTWVKELAEIPSRFVHDPSEAKRLGLIGEASYPSPIVDHALERQITLERYEAMKVVTASNSDE